MQIFHDCRQLRLAIDRLIEIKKQKYVGKINLQDFYSDKKKLEARIEKYKQAKMPTLHIRQEYTLEALLAFAFYELHITSCSDSVISNLHLFTDNDVIVPQADTIYILDYYDYTDEENDPEGYTQYVLANNLELAYNGELFVAVISSYQDYKTEFDVILLIKALEYYCENDDFMKIEQF